MSASNLPFPLPTGYDPSGPYRNPGQTQPFPSPTDAPVGLWNGPTVVIQPDNWAPNPRTGVLYTVSWESPIYDFRPDLRGMTANNAESNPTGRGPGRKSGVPIWRGAGQNVGVHLFLQFEIINADLRGFRAFTKEEGHIADVSQARAIGPGTDVTSVFAQRSESTVFSFTPFGGSAPIRYWKMNMGFEILDGQGFVGPVPTMKIYAMVY